MDFSKFDARKAAETSRELHIRDLSGALMYDHGKDGKPDKTKPCIVMVRGSSSRAVQDEIRESLRVAMKGKDADAVARIMDDYHNDSVAGAARLITGFKNIHRGDQPATADDAKWFLDLTFLSVAKDENGKPLRYSFAQQVLDAGADDVAFLAAASQH